MLKWRRESVLDIYNLHRQPAPRDDEVIASIRASAADISAADISKAAGNKAGPGADAARNVSALLERLAGSDAATRAAPRPHSLHRWFMISICFERASIHNE